MIESTFDANINEMRVVRAESGTDSAAQWMVERIEDAHGAQDDATTNDIRAWAHEVMDADDAGDEGRRV